MVRSVALVVLVLTCARAWADTDASQHPFPAPVINEVLYIPGGGGIRFEAHEHEWVEIHNPGPGDIDLTGWTLSNREGESDISLPSWVLPDASYLTIHLDVGPDDNDFDDLDGHYYTGSSAEVFDDDEDECALYSDAPGAGTIVDFLSWSGEEDYTPGTAHDRAVTAGIWTADDYVVTQGLGPADTVARYFDGYDRDISSDWHGIPWFVYAHNGPIQPENPIQESPQHMVVVADTTPTFDWTDFEDADSYELQVDNGWDFSSPAIDVSALLASEYTPTTPLAEDIYFWRVRAVVGASPTPWSAAWLVCISAAGPPDPGGPGAGPRDAPHKYQRKDTELLCICRDRPTGFGTLRSYRPGCPETGDCAWDKAHPAEPRTKANPGCRHGMRYCWAASTAMVNASYGGDLSQDRIAYETWNTQRSKPEGDLGHNRAASLAQVTAAVSWALDGAGINTTVVPVGGFTFAQLKGWVDDLGCYVAAVPGHAVVIESYLDIHIAGTYHQIVFYDDPWHGPDQGEVLRYRVPGVPLRIDRRLKHRFFAVWLQPAAGVTARMQEAAVLDDFDEDGIKDFDEQNPRTFHSSHSDTDTDKDQVGDKDEIRNYTFHDTYCPGHDNDPLTFSDWDQDGDRSENDCDSDNDGDFDGGEDIDGDGHNPEVGETCMFDPGDWLLMIDVDRDSYSVGDPVWIVAESGTFHVDSTYNYELDVGCPDHEDGEYLFHNGAFPTNSAGYAMETFVFHCPWAGQFYLTVDILDDNNYSEPDNTDPQTCWECSECGQAVPPSAEDCRDVPPGTRCDVVGGADPCVDDDDCADESHCVPAPTDQPELDNVCYAPKTRYISIARNPVQVEYTMRRVKLQDGHCNQNSDLSCVTDADCVVDEVDYGPCDRADVLLGWVDTPSQSVAVAGLWVAKIVPDPVSVQTWPDVVHVWGCEIAHANLSNVTGKHCKPNDIFGEKCVKHCYIVQAISASGDPDNGLCQDGETECSVSAQDCPAGLEPCDEDEFTEEVVLCTTSTWGDMCNVGAGGLRTPPDGVHNLADIMAAIAYFQGDTAIAPLTWLDIAPSFGTGVPDQTISLSDISGFVSGFQGSPYPGLGPLNCP